MYHFCKKYVNIAKYIVIRNFLFKKNYKFSVSFDPKREGISHARRDQRDPFVFGSAPFSLLAPLGDPMHGGIIRGRLRAIPSYSHAI